MKALHVKSDNGATCCVVQLRQYNERSRTAAARYMADLEAAGYRLTHQHGGDVVWNFIYKKIEEKQ